MQCKSFEELYASGVIRKWVALILRIARLPRANPQNGPPHFADRRNTTSQRTGQKTLVLLPLPLVHDRRILVAQAAVAPP